MSTIKALVIGGVAGGIMTALAFTFDTIFIIHRE